MHPDVSPRDIALREDSEGRIFFTGAREEVGVCILIIDGVLALIEL